MASIDAMPLTPDLPGDDDALARIEAVSGVKAVVPRLSFPALIASDDDSTFALVIGTDFAREAQVSPGRRRLLTAGAWPTSHGANGEASTDSGAVVGSELYSGLKLTLNERAAILGSDIDGVMNGVDVNVQGAIAAPTQGEKRLVLIPLAQAQALIRRPGRITEIAVAIDDDADADVVAAAVIAAVGDSLGTQIEAHSWTTLVPFVSDARGTQNAVLRVVTATLLFVILMGLTNTLLMSVFERTREIGTFLALGMKRRRVLALFVTEGVLLGVGGAVIGDVVGAAIVIALGAKGIMLTTPGATLPQLITPHIGADFLVAMVFIAAAGAAVASLSPAWRASRMDPVAALSDR